MSHTIDSHLLDQSGDVITGSFEFRDGCLAVPDGPGLGVELDRSSLDKYHDAYLEHGDRDEFQDERRRGWHPRLPVW